MTSKISNFVVNLYLLLQEGFKICRVHDSIFHWVSAVNGELEVQLLLLHTLTLQGLSLNSFFLGNWSSLSSWGSLLFNSSFLSNWSRGSWSSSRFLFSSLSGGSLSRGSLSRGSLSRSSLGRGSFGGSSLGRGSFSWCCFLGSSLLGLSNGGGCFLGWRHLVGWCHERKCPM